VMYRIWVVSVPDGAHPRLGQQVAFDQRQRPSGDRRALLLCRSMCASSKWSAPDEPQRPPLREEAGAAGMSPLNPDRGKGGNGDALHYSSKQPHRAAPGTKVPKTAHR
jgi:hypothetical protein